uniref:Uncharacterized protein n=1 Tax=Cannabis sativa TaxID=3483 RepID=A0A803R4D7_CANSA
MDAIQIRHPDQARLDRVFGLLSLLSRLIFLMTHPQTLEPLYQQIGRFLQVGQDQALQSQRKEIQIPQRLPISQEDIHHPLSQEEDFQNQLEGVVNMEMDTILMLKLGRAPIFQIRQ